MMDGDIDDDDKVEGSGLASGLQWRTGSLLWDGECCRYFLLVFGFGIDSSTLLGESPVPDCCVAVSRTGCIKCSALTTPAEVATAPNLS